MSTARLIAVHNKYLAEELHELYPEIQCQVLRNDVSAPTTETVPDDSAVSIRKQIKIKTKRKKSFPLFGKVIDVAWAGKDGGTGLAKTICDDTSTKTLATRIGNLEIKSQTEIFQGWTLTVDKQFSPTRQEWETIETTAGYILSSPRSL